MVEGRRRSRHFFPSIVTLVKPQRDRASSPLISEAARSTIDQKFTFGDADWVTVPVAQAMSPEELVAEALGVQTNVVVDVFGKRGDTLPEILLPSVTVTIDSPLTVDITMVAFM